MYSYPKLTPAEQLKLPKLTAAPVAIASKFEDSTHQLYRCDTVDGRMVLKVVQQDAVTSDFWLGVNTLFSADFPHCLVHAAKTQLQLQSHGAMIIPNVVASAAGHFVLSEYIAGKDADHEAVTDDMVAQLATHIGKLHQQRFATWGPLHAPSFLADVWATQLHKTLALLAENTASTPPSAILSDLLQQAKQVNEQEFVTIMPDLRWDQLRMTNSQRLALIDIDAFVVGPRALELVLIEYLLNHEQLALFKKHYSQFNDWPDYAQQKPSYQLLLFLMNVLGQTDLKQWMQGAS